MAKNEEYEDEEVLCVKCKKDITEDDEDNDATQFTCEECNGTFCTNCSVPFAELDITICKGCIDEVYPREEKVVEKIIEVPKETIKVMGFSEPIL